MGEEPVYTKEQPKPAVHELSQEVLPYVQGYVGILCRHDIMMRALIEDYMNKRIAWGTAKYGQPLHTHDGRDTIVDGLQEAADLVMYLGKKRLEEGNEVSNATVRALVGAARVFLYLAEEKYTRDGVL